MNRKNITRKNQRWFITELDGVEFEFDLKACTPVNHGGYVMKDQYKTWSDAKQAVYDFWKDFSEKHHGKNFRIPTANSQQFTIAFQFPSVDGHMLQAYITKAHNYLWQID